jgi:hypothetical protein
MATGSDQAQDKRVQSIGGIVCEDYPFESSPPKKSQICPLPEKQSLSLCCRRSASSRRNTQTSLLPAFLKALHAAMLWQRCQVNDLSVV